MHSEETFDRAAQLEGETTPLRGVEMDRFFTLSLDMLAIARQLVEMHGGTIKVESLGEGKGATFKVMLPLMDCSRCIMNHCASSPN